MIRTYLTAAAVALTAAAQAQLQVSSAMTPAQMVQNVLIGGGVSITNVTYNGFVVSQPQVGSGTFSGGATTNLGLDAGVILSTGDVAGAAGPAMNFAGTTNGTGSDPDLATITGDAINDRAVLEFDFVPNGDSVKFNYVFASEEYPEFVCSFNDAFGFFLSGPGISGPFTNAAVNIALLPDGITPVTIDNVNNGLNNDPTNPGCPAMNPQYYIDNANGTTIAYDGFTVVLTAQAQVICGANYHIKLAIGDAGDSNYDSAVFLQAGSFSSVAPPTVSAATVNGQGALAEGCQGGYFTITRPEGVDSTMTVHYIMEGTATEGTDYTSLPNPVVIPEGQDSVVLPITPLEDGVTEGPETVILTVFAINACGDTLSNSVALAIIDYHPIEIQSPTPLLLHCDQDSVPLTATYTGGFGLTALVWSDSVASPVLWVPGREGGDYTVSVSDQCPRQVDLTVHVDPGCQVIIPNVITPNGDGSNDKFVIKGILGRDNQVQIFDRWGKEVLNASNYRNNFSAKGLHDGVYFYIIRVLDKKYTGHLTVLDDD